jgi:hypothetical protein
MVPPSRFVHVKVLVNLFVRLDINVNVLEGSGVDKPLALSCSTVGDDLGADDMLVVVLLILRSLCWKILSKPRGTNNI